MSDWICVAVLVSSQRDAPNARRKFAGDAFPSFDLGKLGQGFRCGFGLLAKGSGLPSQQQTWYGLTYGIEIARGVQDDQRNA